MSPVATALAQKKVERIVIIDDAYDPITVKSIPSESLEKFWGEIEEDEALQKELADLGITVSKVGDFTDESLQILFAKFGALQGLKIHAQKILGGAIDARTDVDTIKTNLEELQLAVASAGTSEQLTEQECKIYFLDYYLGSTDSEMDANAAVAAAVARAEQIYALYPDPQPRPIIILMSSKPLSVQQIRDFRKQSRLLGGMFHHIPKHQLKDKHTLQRKMLAVAKSLPVAHAIEGLIAAVERSILTVREQFGASLRDLSLEDYVYIQQLSLKEDGQPFGEYLLWLFSSEFHRRAFEADEVRQKENLVNELLPNEELPPRQFKPSTDLAAMYKTALFQEMSNEVKSHPLSSAEQDYPLLALGDIFLNEKKQLYLVLNPACDLAFSPASKGRGFSPNKSIVLIPGLLHPLAKTIPNDLLKKPRTDFFDHAGSTYRIIWDPKRITTREYGEMRDWIRNNELRREYRLRLTYALEVQQAFTADFGRVGPPIAPPIFDSVRAELYVYDEKGKAKLLCGPLEDDAALVMSGESTQCALGLGFLEEFCNKLPEAAKAVEGRITELEKRLDPGPSAAAVGPETVPQGTGPGAITEQEKQKIRDRIERCKSHLARIQEFEKDKSKQMELISKPFVIPEPGTTAPLNLPAEFIHVYHEKEVPNNFQATEPFILRLSSIN
jgi:hypothetical protein